MSIPSSLIPLFNSGSSGGALQVSRSLRFNSADSAYLSKVFAVSGNRRTWTLSAWVKRSDLGVIQRIFSTSNSGNTEGFYCEINSANTLDLYDYSVPTIIWQKTTTQVFRDVGAWFHLQVTFDSTNATADNRVNVYVNGIVISTFSTSSNPSSNYESYWNAVRVHAIGRTGNLDAAYFSGYLANIHFIDGQALTPASFAETDATTGQWIPKAFSGGSYGTNGFYLQFADNSSNTASTLGKDYSGLGNNWTPNNFSVGSSNTTIWSNYVTASTGSFYPGNVASNLFDVNLSNIVDANSTSGTVTFTPPSTIAYSSKVEILQGSQTASYTLTRGDNTTATITSTSNSWSTLTTGSGSIKSISSTGTGNYNNWKAIRVDDVILYDPSAAGIANDSLVDSPTSYGTDTGVGGEVRSNYCTLNPLAGNLAASPTPATFANGNLEVSYNRQSSGNPWAVGTIALPSSGKWYWEFTPSASSPTPPATNLGIVSTDSNAANSFTGGGITYRTFYPYDGTKLKDGSSFSTYGATVSVDDVVGVAVDMDAGNIYFSKNGSWANGSGSFNQSFSGAAAAFTDLVSTGKTWLPLIGMAGQNSGTTICNFGQRAFAYTAPSGFKALCTQNLPAPLVTKSNTVMDVALFTGNGSSQNVTGLNFAPDFVWAKKRSAADSHLLFDVIRGATVFMGSDTTNGDQTLSSGLTAFNSDGFSWGSYGSGATFVGWAWDAGTSTVSNTQGSITSQVRANATAGFSVVTFTAPSSGSATIGHGLGVEPYMVIIKSRDQSYNWCVYHKNLTSNAYFLNLNTTAAQSNASNIWNNTTPTSTVFSLGGGYAGAGATVAYCFSPVVGYSSFGSYTGNGSSDGPMVYTGFRPKWIMYKVYSGDTSHWFIHDTARSPYNESNYHLWANLSNAEATSGFYPIDILSNGFKIRSSNVNINGSGYGFIYMAFAEAPFNYSRAR